MPSSLSEHLRDEASETQASREQHEPRRPRHPRDVKRAVHVHAAAGAGGERLPRPEIHERDVHDPKDAAEETSDLPVFDVEAGAGGEPTIQMDVINAPNPPSAFVPSGSCP
jgi:hypothetical protein